jgi:uncharacterized protein YdaU (DUF1376 family)
MKSEPAPWFAFYPAKFLGGTAHFTNEEVGVYARLLCFQWLEGVPVDRAGVLVGPCQNPQSLPTVLKNKFRKAGKCLVNARLEVERKVTNHFRQQQSTKARRRWQCHGIATALPMDMPQTIKQSTSLIDQTRACARGRLIDEKKMPGGKMNPTFIALKLANRIIANQTGWHYDNCKVDPARLKSSSLQTVILPFVGQFSEAKILARWATAVRAAHAAKVDGLARNATAYAIECFKSQFQPKGKL